MPWCQGYGRGGRLKQLGTAPPVCELFSETSAQGLHQKATQAWLANVKAPFAALSPALHRTVIVFSHAVNRVESSDFRHSVWEFFRSDWSVQEAPSS